MKKYTFILFLLIIPLFFIPFTGTTQDITPEQLLKKTDKSLKDIQTIVYKIDITHKPFTSKDTIKYTAVCSLDLTSQDKAGKYYNYIISKKVKDGTIAYEKYDGVFNSEVYYKTHPDSLEQPKKVFIYNAEEINYGLVNNNTNIMLTNVFSKEGTFTRFKSFFKRTSIQKMEIKEEVFSGIPVYELTIIRKNNNKPDTVNNSVKKYYIRKSDFLPVAYSSYGEFEGMFATEYSVIEYIAINPDIPLETFKVDTTLTEMQPKLLYEKVKKYGL